MAGGSFNKNIGKVRPGTYVNFVSNAEERLQGADRGIVLIPLANTDYGPGGEMITLTGNAPDAARAKLGYSIYDNDESGNMLLIREAFKNALTVIVYICAEGKTAAKGTGGGLSAEAKYKGARGNKLSYSVQANPVSGFDVAVYLDGSKAELYENIKTVKELEKSEYIRFTASGESGLTAAAGVMLSGGENEETTNAGITSFLDAADSVKFNTMAFPFEDESLCAACKAKIMYMRENEGKKVQAVVPNMKSANYEGIINLTNSYSVGNKELTVSEGTAFVAGLTAGAEYTVSNTYKIVHGASGVVGTKNHEQAVSAINNGEFFFSISEAGAVVVEYDINSLVTFTDGKSEDYRKNRVIRVLDSFSDSLVINFPPNKFDNNEDGWNAMEGIGKSILMLYEDAGAIENVDYENDFLVDRESSGRDKTYFLVGIKPTDSAEKLFFSVTTR